MSTEQRHDSENVEPQTDEHHRVIEPRDPGPPTEKPEVTDEHRERAREMVKAYDDQRPTTRLPGSGGAVSGTAVNDWIDETE